MVTMLGKTFPQLGFIAIIGRDELFKVIGVLVVDIRNKVLVSNGEFG